MTDIYAFDLQAEMQQVSASRREKACCIRHEQGQRECIAAYMLLKKALREGYGIEENPEFDYDNGGKPILRDYPHIHFNLSHSRAGVACVVGDEPVGVDIERIRPYRPTLARHVLNDAELEWVERQSMAADKAFIELWTKKEALLKLTGRGLRESLKSVLENLQVEFDTRVSQHFVCTVATYVPNASLTNASVD